MKRCGLLCMTALVSGTTCAAEAVKDFPSKPARIIVGYPAGGGVDMAARLVGQALGELWGQQRGDRQSPPAPRAASARS